MRKLIRLLPVAAVCIALFSCKEEPRNTAPLVDPWLRDRTPVSLIMEGQVGSPVIVNNWRIDTLGTVNVTLVKTAVDLSKLTVEQIVLPEGATASIEAGSKIDLSSETDPTATFTVTSVTKERRVYTLSYNAFEEPLQGTYEMEQIPGILDLNAPKDVVAVVGGYEGGITVSTLNDKSWQWSGLERQFDNIVSFRLEDVDSETGNTFGSVVNFWGADGAYTDYYWHGDSSIDLNSFYRLVPKGQSRWKKWTEKVGDNSFTRITFYNYDTTDYAVEDEIMTSDWIDAETYRYTYPDGQSNPVVVPSGAFHHSWPGPWNDHSDESDGRWMHNNMRETFNMVKKVSDDPAPEHDAWLEMDFE